jgi:hypothetical protein
VLDIVSTMPYTVQLLLNTSCDLQQQHEPISTAGTNDVLSTSSYL